MTEQSRDFQKTIAGLSLIGDLMHAELRKLMERPELYDVATAITDAMLRSLTYLCNYQGAIGGNGKTYPMGEVHARLEKDVREAFEKITGRAYQPEVCRRVEHMRAMREEGGKSG